MGGELTLEAPEGSLLAGVEAILHSILFYRVLGSIEPATRHTLGVSYPVVQSSSEAQCIIERLPEIKTIARASRKFTVEVRFKEKSQRKTSWFARAQDNCWEVWKIQCTKLLDSELAEASARQQLRSTLVKIINEVDFNKDQIPPITTPDVSPFAVEINVRA